MHLLIERSFFQVILKMRGNLHHDWESRKNKIKCQWTQKYPKWIKIMAYFVFCMTLSVFLFKIIRKIVYARVCWREIESSLIYVNEDNLEMVSIICSQKIFHLCYFFSILSAYVRHTREINQSVCVCIQ